MTDLDRIRITPAATISVFDEVERLAGQFALTVDQKNELGVALMAAFLAGARAARHRALDKARKLASPAHLAAVAAVLPEGAELALMLEPSPAPASPSEAFELGRLDAAIRRSDP